MNNAGVFIPMGVMLLAAVSRPGCPSCCHFVRRTHRQIFALPSAFFVVLVSLSSLISPSSVILEPVKTRERVIPRHT